MFCFTKILRTLLEKSLLLVGTLKFTIGTGPTYGWGASPSLPPYLPTYLPPSLVEADGKCITSLILHRVPTLDFSSSPKSQKTGRIDPKLINEKLPTNISNLHKNIVKSKIYKTWLSKSCRHGNVLKSHTKLLSDKF